jgi:hypothetical protein
MNEINLYCLSYVELPTELAAKVKEAVEAQINMDPGDDLGACQAIIELFENAGYAFEPTAPNSSHQNGPFKCPHQTIADAICTMLASTNLSLKKWAYAFYHFSTCIM